jgi:hypothetical protein
MKTTTLIAIVGIGVAAAIAGGVAALYIYQQQLQQAQAAIPSMVSPQCIDFNQDEVCKYVLLTNGTAPANPLIQQQRQQNNTNLLPVPPSPLFNPGDFVGDDYVCYSNGYRDGRVLLFNLSESTICTKPEFLAVYNVGFTDGCMVTGKTKTDCGTIAGTQQMRQGGVQDMALAGIQYYCTSEGCGYYKNGLCLDCDKDNNGIPDELFDPQNPAFEGCDDPGLLCSGGFQIPQGVILRPSFSLNATGFSSSEIPTSISSNTTSGYYNGRFTGQTLENITSSNRTFGTNITAVGQQNRINWLELCLNPLVDYVITEPCNTLTTPDGYTLTSEGQRVLRCLAGGVLVGLIAPEALVQIRQLGQAVNCGGLEESSSQ